MFPRSFHHILRDCGVCVCVCLCPVHQTHILMHCWSHTVQLVSVQQTRRRPEIFGQMQNVCCDVCRTLSGLFSIVQVTLQMEQMTSIPFTTLHTPQSVTFVSLQRPHVSVSVSKCRCRRQNMVKATQDVDVRMSKWWQMKVAIKRTCYGSNDCVHVGAIAHTCSSSL